MTAPSIELRPYQTAAIDAVRRRFRSGDRRALIVLPTGTGKTITALSAVVATAERGGRVLWLAHREELLTQPLRSLAGIPAWTSYAERAGIVQADRDEADKAIVFASVATVGGTDGHRLGRVLKHGAPALVVVDEAHHSPSPTWRRVLDAIDKDAGREVHRLGLTATPERTDRASLAALWGDEPVYAMSIQEAIDDGYLCPPRFVVERIEADVKKGMSDDEIAEALTLAGIIDHTAEMMDKHARGRHCLVFTANVKQATETAERLKQDGWRAAVVSGATPSGQRDAILRAFALGQLDVIANCAVLTEGTDLPICDSIVAARPFSSKPLWIQSVGRGLRLAPGKTDCLVLDLAGASEEHGILHAPALLATSAEEKDGNEKTPTPWIALRALFLPSKTVSAGDKVFCYRLDSKWVASADDDRQLEIGVDVCSDRNVNPFAGMLRDRARTTAEWVAIPGIGVPGWAVDVAEHGSIYVLPDASGDVVAWQAWHVKKRGRTARALANRSVDLGIAKAIGDDLFRQAQGLVRPGASWRSRPASPAAIAYAHQLGIDVEPGASAGTVGRQITEIKAAAAVRRLGLV